MFLSTFRPVAIVVLVALPSFSITAAPARAVFHLWEIVEVFSNANGSVQFIELFNNSNNEHFIANHSITSNSNSFTFPTNLPNPPQTSGRRFLIATPSFVALPGAVTPDYTLPSGNFFDPTGDTLNFANVSIRNFTSIPTDGITAQRYTTTGTPSTGDNTPTNFSGSAGQIDLSAPSPTGDYNGNGVVDAADYVLWRKTLNESADPAGSGADGDGSGTIDAGDYLFWRERFGNVVASVGKGAGIAAPEPTAAGLALLGLFVAAAFARQRFASFANEHRHNQ